MALRTILLVRHGQSASNAGGVTMPHALIPLTDLGRAQAADLALHLPAAPPRLLASPFVRAMDTALPYAQRTGLAVQSEPLLQEFDMIDPALIASMDQLQRRPIADAHWAEGDADKQLGTHAESFRAFHGRVRRFLDDVAPALPDGTVCFGHGIWIGMAAWQCLGFTDIDPDTMRRFRCFQSGLPMPNAAVYELRQAEPGSWFLSARNGLRVITHQPAGASA